MPLIRFSLMVTISMCEERELAFNTMREAGKNYIKAFHAYDVDSDNPQKAQAHIEAENVLIAALALAKEQ